MQMKIGRANLDPNSAVNRSSADAAAGAWIRSHTAENAVVMARHVPTASHYSERRVVWFPPSSDPDLLMAGIRTHGVDFVIVVRRKSSYYLPSDEDCFARLLSVYPKPFRLVDQGSDFRIFRVTPQPVAPRQVSLGTVQ
jgi:hypothetical protein